MGLPADRHLTGPGHPGADETARGGLFWAALIVGWAAIAYGIAGGLDNARDTHPTEIVRWFLGAAVIHDGLIAPAVLLVGFAVGRLLPGPIRGPVQGGLIATAVLMLFALPLVRGYGVRPDNPTVVFRDYGPALLAVLAAVWVVTTAVAVLSYHRSRRPFTVTPPTMQ
jgi:hypothetical protein